MGQSMLQVSGGGIDLSVGYNTENAFITQINDTPASKAAGSLSINSTNSVGLTSYPSWIGDVKDGYVILQWQNVTFRTIVGRINEPFTWNAGTVDITTTFSIKNGSVYMENTSSSSSSYSTTTNYPRMAFIKLA